MKHLHALFILAVVFGFVWGRPHFILAEEMGPEGQAADAEAPLAELAGGEDEGAIFPSVPEEDEVAILTEAAAALDATHPELAIKLRALAANEMNEDETEEIEAEVEKGEEVQ